MKGISIWVWVLIAVPFIIVGVCWGIAKCVARILDGAEDNDEHILKDDEGHEITSLI